MHIVQVAPELTPIAKVGGLGDVVYGLSKELLRQGHKVSCFLPKYACLDLCLLQNVKTITPTLLTATCEGITLFLIDLPELRTKEIYGGKKEVERFLSFCREVATSLATMHLAYDVLHLHDWATCALTPLVEKPTLLTIHNLRYQGKSAWDPSFPAIFQDQQGDLNLLKGGIERAEQITTVSPTYAKEILCAEGSCDLQTTIVANQGKIHGILNGIDENFWNPASDPHLPFHYNTTGANKKNLPSILEGKEKNKRSLLTKLGISYKKNTPLVSCIARLVPQKSPDLIKHACLRAIEKGGQFLLLGNSPIPEIQQEFISLQKECEEHNQGRVIMLNDEPLAHQIYAASDFFLIPSLFEPCGLTQMIALKYGTIPIARMTGGLADTVFDIDTSSISPEKRNGFTFDFPDKEGVNWALDRALSYYFHDKEKIHPLLIQGMQYNFSWEKPCLSYLKLYEAVAKNKTPV